MSEMGRSLQIVDRQRELFGASSGRSRSRSAPYRVHLVRSRIGFPTPRLSLKHSLALRVPVAGVPVVVAAGVARPRLAAGVAMLRLAAWVARPRLADGAVLQLADGVVLRPAAGALSRRARRVTGFHLQPLLERLPVVGATPLHLIATLYLRCVGLVLWLSRYKCFNLRLRL